MSPKDKAANLYDLVVIGSSAGGIEALIALLSALPADFSVPVVVAQHLDRHRSSGLGPILESNTNLKMIMVEESCLLEPGKLYVVPSNRNVAINDGQVVLRGEAPGGSRSMPSVNLLFSSAAEVYGDRLIAVILTGSGSDGAAGVLDVKHKGGTVIVQNPLSARYPSMPLAIPPSVIDFELDVELMGPLLSDLVQGLNVNPPENNVEDTLRAILDLVSHQTNTDFKQYKTNTIMRRIIRRMAVVGQRTMPDYLAYLEAHSEEVGDLVEAFLINVTQFLRDEEAFNYLKNEILPVLISRARERDRVLRFWSAGCATGEEPYSLAMLLLEQLGPELPQWSIKIFATDLDEAAINFARRGYYTENHFRDFPPEFRDRYFEHVDQNYRITKALRQIVIFGLQDLSRSAPFPRIDLVLCRNVLIYFTPELQDYVINQFAFSLYPGGVLMLGKAESIHPSQVKFEQISKPWKVYRCSSVYGHLARQPSNRRRLNAALTEPESAALAANRNASQLPARAGDENLLATEINQLRRFNELLLRFVPVGVLVIDRAYHLWTANTAARRLLGLHNTAKELDFLHSVRGIPYAEVRRAIDSVFRERSTHNLPEVELDASMGGSGKVIALSASLLQLDAVTPDLIAISVHDVTEQVTIRRQLEAAQAEQNLLMQELSGANNRLNDMNKELLDSNEELQVANEELVLTHEELQATIEEFETTNEEMQATNEELETNNEELQATNEEIQITNDELKARTVELQELADLLTIERRRTGTGPASQ